MPNKPICPYYGKNDDLSEVGCDYISTHDVDMIIHFCNKQFHACAKYQELSTRFPLGRTACMATQGH